MDSTDDATWDSRYNLFQDIFRGSFEEIQERQRINLPLFAPVKTAGPIVDIGCGRGEWLSLLETNGFESYGVDSNPDVAKRTVEAGIRVVTADALEYLATLPDRSLAGITAYHLVEHIPTDTLVQLCVEARRLLVTGGILLYETPNPANLSVGAHTFWMDPTHQRPIPVQLLAFIVGSAGFAEITANYIHPSPPMVSAIDNPTSAVEHKVNEVVQAVNGTLSGFMDYMVVARQAAS